MKLLTLTLTIALLAGAEPVKKAGTTPGADERFSSHGPIFLFADRAESSISENIELREACERWVRDHPGEVIDARTGDTVVEGAHFMVNEGMLGVSVLGGAYLAGLVVALASKNATRIDLSGKHL